MEFLGSILLTRGITPSVLEFLVSEHYNDPLTYMQEVLPDTQEGRCLGKIFGDGSAIYQDKFRPEFAYLITNLAEEASKASFATLENIYLPMLTSISNVISLSNTSRVSPLYQSILSSSIKKGVPEKPEIPADRVHRMRMCHSCLYRDCPTINEFLVDPKQVALSVIFSLGAKAALKHVERLLNGDSKLEISCSEGVKEIPYSRWGGSTKAVKRLDIKKISPETPEYDAKLKKYDEIVRPIRAAIGEILSRHRYYSDLLGDSKARVKLESLEPIPPSEIQFPEVLKSHSASIEPPQSNSELSLLPASSGIETTPTPTGDNTQSAPKAIPTNETVHPLGATRNESQVSALQTLTKRVHEQISSSATEGSTAMSTACQDEIEPAKKKLKVSDQN